MANRPLDAATTLLGWINHSATDQNERLITSGTTIRLSTPLDAAEAFTFVASHPGAAAPITFALEVAPQRTDGTIGTWVQAAEVAIPAAGGQVEAPLSGSMLTVAAPDAANVKPPSLLYARVVSTPAPPAGAYAGLTH